jgi:hypothetical protein
MEYKIKRKSNGLSNDPDYQRILAMRRRNYAKNKKRYNEQASKWIRKIRIKAIQRMSPDFSCSECGYNKNIRALTIHHLNNDGHVERSHYGNSMVYHNILSMSEKELKENYKVLCANCHMILKLKDVNYDIEV